MNREKIKYLIKEFCYITNYCYLCKQNDKFIWK